MVTLRDLQGETRKTRRTLCEHKGMYQGNGPSPAAWLVTSIPMISAHKRKGHSAHFIAPISGQSCHLAGGLFVNDTDLFHLSMNQTELVIEAHGHLQESIINWGNLLLATGGALKPVKCSYYLLLFRWKLDGTGPTNSMNSMRTWQ